MFHHANLWLNFMKKEMARPFDRRSRRIALGEPVKLIPSMPRGAFFEEIGTTVNVSRGGFYFLTKQELYEEGMRLLVTLPYHAPPQSRDRVYLAQVVRVELGDDGERGVAIQLLSPVSG